MRILTTAAVCALGIGVANWASAQGPVREGLRRTGEAAANVTRGVVEGTADIARGAGEATLRAGQATANTARGIGNAITPGTPFQARGGGNWDQGREARWRFARHNGEWWYYTPQNNWMYHRDGNWNEFSQDSFQPMNQNQQLAQAPMDQSQQYSAGYRGPEQGQIDQGQMYQGQASHEQLRTDRYGRQYICENGRAVYIDQSQQYQDQQVQGQHLSPTPAEPQEYSAARQNLDQQHQPAQGQIQQGQALQSEQSRSLDATQGQNLQSTQPGAVPATPSTGAAASGSADASVSSAPAGPGGDSQAQGDPAAPREINNTPSPETAGATDQ